MLITPYNLTNVSSFHRFTYCIFIITDPACNDCRVFLPPHGQVQPQKNFLSLTYKYLKQLIGNTHQVIYHFSKADRWHEICFTKEVTKYDEKITQSRRRNRRWKVLDGEFKYFAFVEIFPSCLKRSILGDEPKICIFSVAFVVIVKDLLFLVVIGWQSGNEIHP